MAGPDRVIDFADVRVDVFVTGTWRENCYVVTDRSASESAVIDPGDEADRIIRHVDGHQLRVHLILCTHAHFDHIGGALELSQHTGLPCHVHRSDLGLLQRAPLYALSFERRRIAVPKDVEAFDDRQHFPLGRFRFDTFSSPGHTPGSVCFRYADLLFAGDTVLREKCGRTDLPGGRRDLLERSIDALLDEFEDDLVILPGHGEPWTLHQARRWWSERQTGEAL